MSVTIKEILMDWLDINEFHNVRIDSKSKAYADTLTPDEEFYLMAKTNADDGDAVEIYLNLIDKNKTLLKTIELEAHVENEEVKMTLKVEDLSDEHNLDLNAIKEINATLHYEKEKYPTNQVRIYRTLKSKELSDSGELNDVVEGKVAKAYKKSNGTTPNSTGDDVKQIQTALQKMKINIGNDGIDGVFGNDGHNAVMTFQENYKPTHDVHQYTWGEPDGVVGRNTLLAMDEALVGGWKYDKKCKISIKQLKQIFTKATNTELQETATTFNNYCHIFEINTPLRVAHFFAQCREEVGDSITITESLNYKASVLKSGYPFSYFKNNTAEAEKYGRTSTHSADQEAIANRSYANRNGNGDIATGDGWKFRGKGFIQLTGKANYKGANKILKTKVPELKIDLLKDTVIMDTIKGSLLSAMAYWTEKEINKVADTALTYKDVDKVTLIVNRYTESKTDRQEHFKKTVEVFKK